MPLNRKFKGITGYSEYTFTQQLENNLLSYINWNFLQIGAFYNTVNQSGAYGGNFSTLRPATTRHYQLGKIWEGPKNDWVWESGIDYSTQPINISGVYVNNVFYPSTGTGQYAHTINYPMGQVVFADAISPTSVVKLNYSYRHIHVEVGDSLWFKELKYRSFRPDDSHYTQSGSGDWEILSQNRISLPCLIIESVPSRDMKPLQIGGGQKVYQDVLFHIYAENKYDRDKILDIITFQNESTINGFDLNEIKASGDFPLNISGSKVNNPKMYPQLAEEYFWNKITFFSSRSQSIESKSPLYKAVVRTNFEIYVHDI